MRGFCFLIFIKNVFLLSFIVCYFLSIFSFLFYTFFIVYLYILFYFLIIFYPLLLLFYFDRVIIFNTTFYLFLFLNFVIIFLFFLSVYRVTPTTFPDCLGNRCRNPLPQMNATQTDIHNIPGPSGRGKLLSSISGECHPNRHQRHSQTDWSTEPHLLHLWWMPPRQTPTMFPDYPLNVSSSPSPLVNATQTDTYDVPRLSGWRMPPRQTPTTFSDCLDDRCDTPLPPVNTNQTDIHDIPGPPSWWKLLFSTSGECHPDRHLRRSRTTWATIGTQTDTHNVSGLPGQQIRHSSSSGEWNPDKHTRRSQTA